MSHRVWTNRAYQLNSAKIDVLFLLVLHMLKDTVFRFYMNNSLGMKISRMDINFWLEFREFPSENRIRFDYNAFLFISVSKNFTSLECY